jgi:proteasome lid subunit RPN8/RPN11
MPSLLIPAQVVEAILQHARAQSPDECCGALLARSGSTDPVLIERAVPLENEAAAPRTHYAIGARSLLNLERAAALDDLEVIGFYHSHPAGLATPSDTDCNAAVPWYTYLIAGLESPAGTESLRAYRFEQGAPSEVRIDMVQGATSPW